MTTSGTDEPEFDDETTHRDEGGETDSHGSDELDQDPTLEDLTVDDRFIESVGLGHLSPTEQSLVLARIRVALERRVGERLGPLADDAISGLSDQDAAVFDANYDADPAAAMSRFIDEHILQAPHIVAEEISVIRKSILQDPDSWSPFSTPGIQRESLKRLRGGFKYDLFICHASEDKERFVSQLVGRLRADGVEVWFDELNLRVGDSLISAIERGLEESRFGVVVISEAFIDKSWPRNELNALTTRQITTGQRVVLPIYLGVKASDVRRYAPLLADSFALNADEGLSAVARKI